MKKSIYTCDLCGDKVTTDEIISGKATNTKLYGLYYISDSCKWEKRPIFECNHHICFKCIEAICRIAKGNHLDSGN